MKIEYPFVVNSSASLLDAIMAIELNNERTVFVTSSENRVVGVVTEGDILRAILRGADTRSRVSHWMQINFTYLEESSTDEDILDLFSDEGFLLLPVLSENRELLRVEVVREVAARLLSNPK